jgi:CHASE3 domain sensor protein
MNSKQAKERIKKLHTHQKLAKTRKVVAELMQPDFGKTLSEMAVEVVQKLSDKHLKRIESNPESFEKLSPEGDLARLAKDELVLRALQLSKE